MVRIETIKSYRDGREVHMHRCRTCVGLAAVRLGGPPVDNGFVPADVPVPHERGCSGRSLGSDWSLGNLADLRN